MKRVSPIIAHSLKRQSGIALISMLLVFGLVVILVGSAISNTSLNITKARYHLQYSQAYQYALGAEALARQILHKDWQDDQELKIGDHLNESWAQPFQFEPDGGLMRVLIRDLNGRFNLNSLIAQDGKNTSNTAPIFNRLLQPMDISTLASPQIIDWIDLDTQPRTARSEDAFFQSQTTPYRSADRSMSHISELISVQLDLEELSLLKLQAHVTVLPDANSSININTASGELLASLHKDLNQDEVIRVRSDMKNGFTGKQAFLEHSVTAGVDFGEININVNSQYFEVWVVAQFNDQLAYLRSVLYRDRETGIVRTLSRDQSRNQQVNPLLTLSLSDKTLIRPEDNN